MPESALAFSDFINIDAHTRSQHDAVFLCTDDSSFAVELVIFNDQWLAQKRFDDIRCDGRNRFSLQRFFADTWLQRDGFTQET